MIAPLRPGRACALDIGPTIRRRKTAAGPASLSLSLDPGRTRLRISSGPHSFWHPSLFERPVTYPRIAALALTAASVIASLADLVPETTSLTPIMNASCIALDCG